MQFMRKVFITSKFLFLPLACALQVQMRQKLFIDNMQSEKGLVLEQDRQKKKSTIK